MASDLPRNCFFLLGSLPFSLIPVATTFSSLGIWGEFNWWEACCVVWPGGGFFCFPSFPVLFPFFSLQRWLYALGCSSFFPFPYPLIIHNQSPLSLWIGYTPTASEWTGCISLAYIESTLSYDWPFLLCLFHSTIHCSHKYIPWRRSSLQSSIHIHPIYHFRTLHHSGRWNGIIQAKPTSILPHCSTRPLTSLPNQFTWIQRKAKLNIYIKKLNKSYSRTLPRSKGVWKPIVCRTNLTWLTLVPPCVRVSEMRWGWAWTLSTNLSSTVP